MAQFSLMSIEELRSRGSDELARLLKSSEQEKLRLTAEHSRTMKDVNRKLQAHVGEIRGLQEANQRLQGENEELQDLCCFLDTSRQKDQRVVQEWQKFGRYTSDVMSSDVRTFQKKLGVLEARLDALTKENIELKELCLLLADDRATQEPGQIRDMGDGSSSDSPSNDKLPVPGPINRNGSADEISPALNDEAVQYLRYLETRVSHLEQENNRLTQTKSGEGRDYRKFVLTAEPSSGGGGGAQRPLASQPRMVGAALPNRPRISDYQTGHNENSSAAKVLEVHEQLDRPSPGIESGQEVMDESEKAIVRQMCNVVWRKLGGAVPGYKTAV